jgi:hypothetical protein
VNGLNNNVKVNNELVSIQTIMNTKIGRRKLTPTIDSIMKANKQRFAMASVTTGRKKKAIMETKLRKELGWYFNTWMYAPVPVNQVFSLFTIILDSERNEVVYYCRTL